MGIIAWAGGKPKTIALLRNAMLISIAAAAATVAVPLARRFLDRRSFVSLGLKWDIDAVKDLLFGFFLSGFMAALFFAVVAIAGLIEVSGWNWGGGGADDPGTIVGSLTRTGIISLGFMLLLHAIVSWWEEIVFRGYLFQNMIEGMGLAVAIAISCILYGLVHSTNPNAGLLSSAIIMLFGYLRIFGYLATARLWLSMGMHLGWNFFQGPVFGFAASGVETPHLIAHSPVGPDWLSGGAFGPEGSVLIIPILALALAAMRWWGARAEGIVPDIERPKPAAAGSPNA